MIGMVPTEIGQQCGCSGKAHDCVHSSRCVRRHGIGGDVLTWSSISSRLLCGGCRAIFEPGNKATIKSDTAVARRQLEVARGQLDMFDGGAM